jgi:ankyrin repeat protein/8-oxo-dGTP pyrophosphatase MutT (NUDIX family)
LASKLTDGGCPVEARYFAGQRFNKGENQEGWTALFFAVEARNQEFVSLLLENGADVNLKSKYGQTVLDVVLNLLANRSDSKLEAIIKDLKARGAVQEKGVEPEEETYSDNKLTVAAMIVGKHEDGQVSVVLGRNRDYTTRRLKPAVFPGGLVDLTDSSSVDAIQREVFEETRLDLRKKDCVLWHMHRDFGGKIKYPDKQQGVYYRHETYLFKDIPLGKVRLCPSDDLAELDIVRLSDIQNEKGDHGHTSYFYMRGQTKVPIQYSNGLLIESYKTAQGEITQEQSDRISKALQLEHRGTELLCHEITKRRRADRTRLRTLISSVNLSAAANVYCDCEIGRTNHSVTPLAAASSVGDEQTINELLALGISPDGLGGDKGGAVYYTVFSKAANRLSILKLLLDAGANPDLRDANSLFVSTSGQFTPLMFALQRGETDMAKMLIEAGADVDYIATQEHSTPLILAVRKNDFGMVQMLVSRGARIDVVFSNPGFVDNLQLVRISAVEEASKLGFRQMAKFLERLNGNRSPFA